MIEKLKHIWHYFKAVRYNTKFYKAINDDNNVLSINVDKSILQGCRFDFYEKGNKIIIEDGCILNGVWFFLGGDNNTIHIGANTYCNADSNRMDLLSTAYGTRLIIGERCLFANNIEIQTTDHHKILNDGIQTNLSRDVVIGNHCWVAARSTILKGVHLADNTVVAAGSIVVKDVVEQNCVVAGNPAKVVKSNIDWDF